MKKNYAGIATVILIAAAFIYMLLTAFGGSKTFWGWDARQASFIWKIVMFIPFIFAYKILSKMETVNFGNALLLLCLVALGFAASTGFKFTGGDIKQRITYLDNQGRVKDTTVLFKYYENFYHFKTDTALKNYVIQYGELPGRNLWNTYILQGDMPRSTAPRSDEDFKWHTGAYEMDLKEKLK